MYGHFDRKNILTLKHQRGNGTYVWLLMLLPVTGELAFQFTSQSLFARTPSRVGRVNAITGFYRRPFRLLALSDIRNSELRAIRRG
jgi:hypothetical protein